MTEAAHIFSYDDPRLTMTLAGRLFVRTGQLVALIIFITATVLSIVSTITWVRWTGIFMGLVLIDFLLHREEGDVPVEELASHERIELSRALTPRVAAMLHHAFDASRITRTEPALELTAVLLSKREIKRSLARENIVPHDVMAKAREFMTREEAHQILTRKERIGSLKDILAAAFLRAEEKEHKFITLTDLFYGIPEADHGLALRLFTVFDIPAE